MTAADNTSLFKSPGAGQRLQDRRGFTLIELMIVISIIGILAAIAVPNYQWSVIKAKEAVLSDSLYNFNTIIDQYFADTGEYPATLDALVQKKYLRSIPLDPFTRKADWIYDPPPPSSGGGQPTEVPTVRSASDLIGTNGKPYNEW